MCPVSPVGVNDIHCMEFRMELPRDKTPNLLHAKTKALMKYDTSFQLDQKLRRYMDVRYICQSQPDVGCFELKVSVLDNYGY